MKNKNLGAIFIVLMFGILLAGCELNQKIASPPITNFEECVAAGNLIMESYPRQCRADNQTFVEVINNPTTTLSEAEAKTIAQNTCIKGGDSLGEGMHNEGTKTWWFDANLNAAKPGCNPACVVSEETKTAEINWRCTGLLQK